MTAPAGIAWPASAPWLGAAAGFALCGGAWLVHTRVRGFLPEDVPIGGHKVHDHPVPQAGFVLGAAAVAALASCSAWMLAAAMAVVTWVGIADDVGKHSGGADWRIKGALQLAAAALIAAGLGPEGAPWAETAVVVAFAWVVINAVNFLDNVDGASLAIGGCGVALATGGGDGVLGACGCAFLGMLPWNWPRPRLFPGDGGALSLGALLAAASVQRAWLPDGLRPLPLVAAAALPLLDFTQVTTARLLLGRPPWIGDRRHLTHIAMYLGLPRPLVAPLFAAAVVGAFVALERWR